MRVFYCGRTLILLRAATRLGKSTGLWVDTPSWQRLSQPVSKYTHVHTLLHQSEMRNHAADNRIAESFLPGAMDTFDFEDNDHEDKGSNNGLIFRPSCLRVCFISNKECGHNTSRCP